MTSSLPSSLFLPDYTPQSAKKVSCTVLSSHHSRRIQKRICQRSSISYQFHIRFLCKKSSMPNIVVHVYVYKVYILICIYRLLMFCRCCLVSQCQSQLYSQLLFNLNTLFCLYYYLNTFCILTSLPMWTKIVKECPFIDISVFYASLQPDRIAIFINIGFFKLWFVSRFHRQGNAFIMKGNHMYVAFQQLFT